MRPEYDRKRAYQLFAQALALDAAERAQYVAQACGSDHALRAAVERYLATAAANPGHTRALQDTALADPSRLIGESLGHFRLVELIGQGGMGVVFRAERTDGVQQTVAIKLLHSALDEQARSRFRREAQLLARLEHPSIARLVDADIDGERTWIALEFVRGEPIDAYCERLALALPAMVALLAQIAEAVAAAHALLIVHSDIKPSNVLVTADGTPRLIDFGIASALADGPAEPYAPMYTPHFAAPEQVLGEPVTVATDVFGLGALAYRLLSGHALLADRDAAGYLHHVTRPSLAPPSLAADRVPATQSRVRHLRGDLDAIVLRALARLPEHRYASAADLAADLHRYLEHRPVLARTPSLAYRAGRFVRRHTAATLLGTLLGVSLLTGFVVSTVETQRARVARDEARAVTGFLTNDILAAANPMVSGTRDVQLRPLLDHAADSLTSRFAGHPRVLADIQSALGTGYAALFDAKKAETQLTAAEQGLAQTYGNGAPETEAARLSLWYLYLGLVDMPDLAKVSARMYRAELAAGHPHSANALRGHLMIELLPCMGRAAIAYGWSQCAPIVQKYLAEARQYQGEQSLAAYEMGWLTGVALIYSSREDQAVPYLRTACAGMEHYYGAAHHRLTACRRFLAIALDDSGQPVEALPLFETAIRNFSTTLGPESVFAGISQYEYASAQLDAGHLPEARAAIAEAVHTLEGPHCDCQSDALLARVREATIFAREGRMAEASKEANATLSKAEQLAGPRSADLIPLRSAELKILLMAGQLAAAHRAALQNLSAAAAIPGRPAWLDAQLQVELAQVLMDLHEPAPAAQALATALPVLERELGSANPRTLYAEHLASLTLDAAAVRHASGQ